MKKTVHFKKFHTFALSIACLTIFSCGTTTPVGVKAEPAHAQLIDEEIQRFDDAGVIHIESTYYNPHIKGFLTAYNNGERMVTDQLQNILTVSEINKILNPGELNHLIQQLNDPAKVPATSLTVSRKVLLEDLRAGGEKPMNNNQRLADIEKDRMIISTPIYTRDKEFAFIDVSKGRLNSMYTTINLYHKKGSDYVFYKTLLAYME